MDTDTATHLLAAFRGCGLHTADRLAQAAHLLTGGADTADDAALAERLFAAELLTPYMYRKVRANRTYEVIFGPYLILDKVGEGGMGKVYRAVECPSGRLVALKVVRQHLMANKTVKGRYKKEAAAAASLDHPNVVKLFGADEINGRYYLAMEYVDGIDLSKMVKEFGTPPHAGLPQYQEACEYARQAALGLQHAHDRGLVHRDVKPSNLLVFGERALPGTTGTAQVKVLDMGLVRSLTPDEDPDAAELTRDGTVVGTPDYMSPEQAKNSSTVDARADLYSLGCTLYYLLRGRPPFPEGTPIDKLLRHQLDLPPDLRVERPELPHGLVEIVKRLMAKRPADRYQTARDAAEALARYCGAVAPEHEPFSFTDGLHAPAADPATPTPVGDATPVAPARPPVRLRVAAPKSDRLATAPAAPMPVAPVAVRARVPAAPLSARTRAVAIPTPEAAPSSDSLPSMNRTPVRGAAVPTRRPSGSPPPRGTAEAGKPKASPWAPVAIVAGVGALAVVGLVAVGVYLARTGKTDPESTRPTTVAAVVPVEPPDAGPAVVKPPAAVPPVAARLPGGATGVLVVRPQGYWQRFAYEKLPDSRLTGHVETWTRKLGLDPRRCQRGLVVFRGPAAAVVAEGAFPPRPATGALPAAVNGLAHATALGTTGDAHALAATTDFLDELRAGPAGPGSPDLVKVLDAAETGAGPGDEPPLVLFAATGGFVLPEGDTLATHGVRQLTVSVRLAGDDLLVRFALQGKSKAALDDFLSIYLATRMLEQHPAVKPLIDLLAGQDGREAVVNGATELTVTARLPWATAHDTLDKLLPAATAK